MQLFFSILFNSQDERWYSKCVNCDYRTSRTEMYSTVPVGISNQSHGRKIYSYSTVQLLRPIRYTRTVYYSTVLYCARELNLHHVLYAYSSAVEQYNEWIIGNEAFHATYVYSFSTNKVGLARINNKIASIHILKDSASNPSTGQCCQ